MEKIKKRGGRLCDKSVDLVLTDIPYGEVNRKSKGLRKLDKGIADVTTFSIQDLMDQLFRVCKGSMYIFCGIDQVSEIRRIMNEEGLSTRLCIWEKTNPSPINGEHLWLSGIECIMFGKYPSATFNYFCKNAVFRSSSERNTIHPTQKPIHLLEYIIEASSNVGDVVLDCCMGSGSTGIACLNTNRNFIGIEIDDAYFKIAKARIEHTQKYPEIPYVSHKDKFRRYKLF